MKKNALIIGCGHIGAGYDFNNNNISTHAKALFLTKKFNLYFYDIQPEIARNASLKYQGVCITSSKDLPLESSDWISVCSPTKTHFEYLVKVLKPGNKLILCEKPVSNNMAELAILTDKCNSELPLVYVNYFRRFLPAYINLRNQYPEIWDRKRLKACTIDYCRGFLNNASHAFDLLEFLMDENIDLQNIRISKKVFDIYKDDPTMSMTADWHNTRINIVGHAGITGFLFRIKLFFDSYSVEFLNSGDDICITENSKTSKSVFRKSGCLKNYMKYVVMHLIRSIQMPIKSNFAPSIELNKKLLTCIS